MSLQESLDLWQRGGTRGPLRPVAGPGGEPDRGGKSGDGRTHVALTNGQNSLSSTPRLLRGVDRAVVTVEKALDLYGPPIYVRKQIVHNVHVVADLERRGAIFVDETDEVPEGSWLVFSAHGVSPSVHDQAQRRNLKAIDATCPLVTRCTTRPADSRTPATRSCPSATKAMKRLRDGWRGPEAITVVESPKTPTASNWIRIGPSHGCPRPRCPSMKPCRRWTVCASACRC